MINYWSISIIKTDTIKELNDSVRADRDRR